MTGFDLDRLLEPPRWTDSRCHVAQALDEIADPEARTKVADAARNKQVPVERLAAAFLHLGGQAPKAQGLRRHRAGHCACP